MGKTMFVKYFLTIVLALAALVLFNQESYALTDQLKPGEVENLKGLFKRLSVRQLQELIESTKTGGLEQWQMGMFSIAITVGPLIGGIMLFMVLVRKAKADVYEPFFGDGQLAQLVVIVLIAGNVCSLAIVGVLGASEVAAIYGGIVGYVLGRRVRQKKGDSEGDENDGNSGKNSPKRNSERQAPIPQGGT